jgi:hypothetical protein
MMKRVCRANSGSREPREGLFGALLGLVVAAEHQQRERAIAEGQGRPRVEANGLFLNRT